MIKENKVLGHLSHIQNIVDHIKKKHMKQLIDLSEIIDTSDGRKWLYDKKNHEWIDVTRPIMGEFVKLKGDTKDE